MFSDPDYTEVEDLANEDFSDEDEDGALENNFLNASNANPNHKKQNEEFQERFENENKFITERLLLLKKLQEKKFNKFPATSGLSGTVFQSGKLIFCNDKEKETNFVDEIDN